MKKFLATVAISALAITGLLFTADQPTETASELEPTVFSIQRSITILK